MNNLKKELEYHRDLFKDSKEELTLNIVLDQVQEKVLEFEKEYYRLINKYYIVYDNETERIPNLIIKIFGDFSSKEENDCKK